ncbi:hypothetical protein Dvina_25930 [Dactylosporangium vinaceum]|uniref:Uncharacterized protein n=1 Tax=Dactylosporangium vinaceum TaxID=53362 RepID=A0ABV5MDE2_9ACTN|nr:hypothetical protein [Dactylosporangium vinaceum]UAC01183.1 hypothetical protein Dvina_25930 [Dactylosporangium vinaceum]
MTTPQGQPVPPVVPVALSDDLAGEERTARDAEDGTPVGQADQRADVERSGGDPDEV